MYIKKSFAGKGMGMNNSFRYSESKEVMATIIVTVNNIIEMVASLFWPLTVTLIFFDNIMFLTKNID
jgi:hypothetical protein